VHYIFEKQNPSRDCRLDGEIIDSKALGKMTGTTSVSAAQATDPIIGHGQPLTAEEALEIARERFPNLSCQGILPKRAVGDPVDLADIEVALKFLSQCRRTAIPKFHSFDLRRMIGDVQIGAVIAAAVALGFDVRAWYGTAEFLPHAVIGVNANDVRRVAGIRG
jgi:hypothetical protein